MPRRSQEDPMSQTVIRLSSSHARPGWSQATVRRLALLWARLAEARSEALTRRQLAQLDDRGLSDIGVSRAQAQFEAERSWELVPFLHR